MSDRWDSYLCQVNDELASILLDLGVRDEVPQAARPKLLFVWVQMQEARPDGLSTPEEYDRLVALEETIEGHLREEINTVFVGRIMTQGRRELYFYAPDNIGFEAKVNEIMERFPGYSYECGSQDDPEWTQYLDVLCPSPEQMQCIKNRWVVEVLEENGDGLTTPRQVDHWIFLASEEDSRAMAGIVQQLGFEVVGETVTEQEGDEHPFKLQFKRVDAVDQDSIDAVTLQLSRLCQEAGAVYDGWETHVVKPDSKPDS